VFLIIYIILKICTKNNNEKFSNFISKLDLAFFNIQVIKSRIFSYMSVFFLFGVLVDFYDLGYTTTQFYNVFLSAFFLKKVVYIIEVLFLFFNTLSTLHACFLLLTTVKYENP
jgi:hypothetical protein